MPTIYKTKETKEIIFQLYDEKLKSLNLSYEEIDVQTSFGRTRIVKTGNEEGERIILFHGIHAGAPLALEAIKDLSSKYLIFAVDTIGQATKSEETVLNIKDDSYALWVDEFLEQLEIQEANFVGVSYGAFILQKTITFKPDRVAKCIFVVPGGLVNGTPAPSFTKLSLPLIKYMITKKDDHLRKFLKAFVPEDDHFMFRLQKALLTGVKIDFRRPLLLKNTDVNHFTKPVYIMVADDDIFFPGIPAVKRAKQIFANLKGVHYLRGSKHMPHKNNFHEIQRKIETWVDE